MDAPLDVAVRPVGAGTVRVLTMNRPEARNAMDTGLLTALVEALADADADDGVRGLVVTGAGRTFSAGADVQESLPDGGRRRMELFTVFYEQLTTHRLPTVAAVEGAAVGGGAEAAAACDVRFGSRSAYLRFPGSRFGIPVGPARTTGLVGLGVAKDWVLSGRDVAADEADRAGFFQQLVDVGETLPTALAWIELVASRDPDTVALQKRMFNDFGGVRDRVAWENDALRAQQEAGPIAPRLDQDLPRTVRPRRS